MYNRDWLKTQIQGYLHDASITAHLDTWIDIGAKRVSQILQCAEMEAELTRSTGDANLHIPLSSTERRLLGVQWEQNGIYINLESVPRHDAWRYKRNGNPAVYYIEGRKIWPAPFVDGNYKAQVLQEVVIPADGTSEVDALTAYPFIFLNAALAEAYDWKQDQEMLARYENKWTVEAREVTDLYMSERIGDTPAMRAV